MNPTFLLGTPAKSLAISGACEHPSQLHTLFPTRGSSPNLMDTFTLTAKLLPLLVKVSVGGGWGYTQWHSATGKCRVMSLIPGTKIPKQNKTKNVQMGGLKFSQSTNVLIEINIFCNKDCVNLVLTLESFLHCWSMGTERSFILWKRIIPAVAL